MTFSGLIKKDPRNLPSYTLGEVAHYLSLPASTLRHWARGQAYATKAEGRKNAERLFDPATGNPVLLSFWNLVEVYVLACIRRQHEVPMQKVRKSLRYVQRNLRIPRPLIQSEFLTDGVDLFVDQYAHLINVSKEGQLGLREVLINSLKRIDRDTAGLAIRVSPWILTPNEPRYLEIDPERAFGRLVVAGTGIPTEILAERFRAGDSIDHLVEEYKLTRDRIEMALRWEQSALAA